MTPSDSGLQRRLAIEGRRIAAQHAKLGELCGALIDALASGVLAAAYASLATLHDGLLAHFDVEEKVQIPALHGSDPSLEPRLRRIVQDHAKFRADLDRISRAVHDDDLAGAREPLTLFIADLADHEAREEELFGLR